MTNTIMTREQVTQMIETDPIRDLVERYPQLLPLLASYGMDLCCGGGHTLQEAARLHGLDVIAVLRQVADLISSTSP